MNSNRQPIFARCRRDAFTVIELVVVLATLGLLAALVLPALAGTRPQGQVFQCLNNTRQLTLATLVYAADYNDRLMPSGQWVAGAMDWSLGADNFNTSILTNPALSRIGGYVTSPSLFKCPADRIQPTSFPGPRVRSYTMNSALNGSLTIGGSNPGGHIYFAARKTSELLRPGPANTWAILEEHCDSISDALFKFRPGHVTANYQWQDLPAAYHDGAGVLSFMDGRSEIRPWQDARTRQEVKMLFKWWELVPPNPGPGTFFVANSLDYQWMNAGMPYQ